MKRRQTDEHDQISDQEIKQARATPFQWATLFFSNLPMIVKVIMLLGIGGVSATQAPKIYQALNGEDDTLPIAPGETVVPQEIPPELKQSLDSMNAAIARLQEENKAIRSERRNGDAALRADVDKLKELVQ